LLIIENREKRR